MDFKEIIYRKCGWIKGWQDKPGIALCSRVRLARNFSGIPFPNSASPSQLDEVINRVIASAGNSKMLGGAIIKKCSELKKLDMQFLLESHLISREFAKKEEGSIIIIGENGAVNIMVNEEDHLRLQVMKPGADISEAWSIADSLETELGAGIDFAFTERWGYLTACPTNLGTGLRASVMMHLPSLVISRRIVEVLTNISRAGIIPRGAYGEGSEPSGNLFQISNQFTLGKTEESIIAEIERAAEDIIKEEENSRELLMSKDRQTLEDKIYRAFGILKSARIISSSEALELLSHLKLGVNLGMIDLKESIINGLIIDVRPAHLQKIAGCELSRRERDVKRAELIRKKLSEKGG
jgi:protein arginine kinase